MIIDLFAPHCSDAYKYGHGEQLHGSTEMCYLNMTARSDKFAGNHVYDDWDKKIVLYGVSAAIQVIHRLWKETFFDRPKVQVDLRLRHRMLQTMGYVDERVVNRFIKLWYLQYLPIKIKALKEGTLVPLRVPFLTIRSTLPGFAWLPGYLETALSSEFWPKVTIATATREIKKIQLRYAAETGAAQEFVDHQSHDFSARGKAGIFDCAANQSAHLLYFKGTDTLSAADFAEEFYADTTRNDYGVQAQSVYATEHLVTTTNIQREVAKTNCSLLEAESKLIGRLLTETYPQSIVSYVADSYSYWDVVTKILPELKEIIQARGEFPGAKFVVRPDSGDPYKIICGDAEAPEGSPEHKGTIECLYEIFGGGTNELGYKQLAPCVGAIYGEGIDLRTAVRILEGLKQKGFCSDTVLFGKGSASVQLITRDTFGLAMKCTYAYFRGLGGVDIYKDPATGDGTKKSAKGLLRVELVDGEYTLFEEQTPEEEEQGELRVVYHNGLQYNKPNFTQLKELTVTHF